MKKQVVAISVAIALSLLGLPSCSENSSEGKAESSAAGDAQNNAAQQVEGASDFAEEAWKYHVQLASGSLAPAIEYSVPVGVTGDIVKSGSDGDRVLFVFDVARLSDEGVGNSSSAQVLDALNDHILTLEYTEYRSIGRLQSVSVASQSDMTVSGAQMTKNVGTLEGTSGSRPFVGYAAVTDGLATWFFVVDDSKDASNSQDVLEDWADKIAQTYRVVS